jgi:hypothetical protein
MGLVLRLLMDQLRNFDCMHDLKTTTRKNDVRSLDDIPISPLVMSLLVGKTVQDGVEKNSYLRLDKHA